MAKRKLTPKARGAVRRDMKKMLGKKMKPSEILAAVAKKYPIGVESARWYLRSITGGSPSRRSRRSNGAVRLPNLLWEFSDRALRRTIKARRLIPRLNELLRKKHQLARNLEKATREAAELERKINRMSGKR